MPLLLFLIRKRRSESWKKHDVGAVVILPTRELAIQVSEVLIQLLVHIEVTN